MSPTPMFPTLADKTPSPWKQRLFQVAVVFLVLSPASGFFALIGAVLMIVWVARRPESGSKKSGAFALTCGILSLPVAAIAYFIVQAMNSDGGITNVSWLIGLVSTILFVFGGCTLIIGIIKRINA